MVMVMPRIHTIDGDGDVAYTVMTEVLIAWNPNDQILVPLPTGAELIDASDADANNNIFLWEGNVFEGFATDGNGDGDINDIAIYVAEANIGDFNNDGDRYDEFDGGDPRNQKTEADFNADMNADGDMSDPAAGVFNLADNTVQVEFGATTDVNGAPSAFLVDSNGDGFITGNDQSYFMNSTMEYHDIETPPSYQTLTSDDVGRIYGYLSSQANVVLLTETDIPTITLDPSTIVMGDAGLGYSDGTNSVTSVTTLAAGTVVNGNRNGFNDWNNNGKLDLNTYYLEHPDEVSEVIGIDGNQDGNLDAVGNSDGEDLDTGIVAQSEDTTDDGWLNTNLEFAPDVDPLVADEIVIQITDLEKADGGAAHAEGDLVTASTQTITVYDTDNSGDHNAVRYAIAPATDDSSGDPEDVNKDGDPSNDFIVTETTITDATAGKSVVAGKAGTDGWKLEVEETRSAAVFTYDDVAPITENTDLVYGIFLGMELSERFSISVGITHYDGGELRVDMSDTSADGNEAVFENNATMFDVTVSLRLGS